MILMKNPKTAMLTMVSLILVCALIVGCTFTGAVDPTDPEETTPSTETTVPDEAGNTVPTQPPVTDAVPSDYILYHSIWHENGRVWNIYQDREYTEFTLELFYTEAQYRQLTEYAARYDAWVQWLYEMRYNAIILLTVSALGLTLALWYLAKAAGRNVLLINQRCHGGSEGHTITFGILESKDCARWGDFAVDMLGADARIILTGISMGAATVLMASGEKLPKNVVCVLADCGYTSPKAIIQKVIQDMKLPIKLVYPFVRFGARMFGGFDLEETSPIEAVKKSRVPVIYIHGETDDFVPCEMSRLNFEACASKKSLVTIANAGHGLAYPVDKEKYLQALRDFEKEWKKCAE